MVFYNKTLLKSIETRPKTLQFKHSIQSSFEDFNFVLIIKNIKILNPFYLVSDLTYSQRINGFILL